MTMFTDGRLQAFERMMQDTRPSRDADREWEKQYSRRQAERRRAVKQTETENRGDSRGLQS